jgi:secreted Zn-dependent insulinase-like peptidase
MGRGRAKAKQTKVARDLKYRTFDTDFDQLQRELQSQSAEADNNSGDDADEAYDDPYAHDPYAADPHDDDAESTRRS